MTTNGFLNLCFSSFEARDGYNFVDLFDFLDVDELEEFKNKGTLERLFLNYLEVDQGVFYDYEKSFMDDFGSENYYVLKSKEQPTHY